MGDAACALLDGAQCVGEGRAPAVSASYSWSALGRHPATWRPSVRLLTRQGAVVGRSLLRLDDRDGELPQAVALVQIGDLGADVLGHLDREGVVVDSSALEAMPDLDEHAIRARLDLPAACAW